MARKLCTVCNTRAVGTGGGDDADSARSLGECNPCYTEGGWENSHSDEDHDSEPNPHCWICHPELNLAQKDHTPRTRTGHHSPRRGTINHRTQCSHAQTPAARRACRKAYWTTNKEK